MSDQSLCDNCRFCCYLTPSDEDPFYSSWCSCDHFSLVRTKDKNKALDNIPHKSECKDFLSRNVPVKNGVPIHDDIELETSWYDLLGKDSKEYSDEERKGRWETWKWLARQRGEHDMVDYWSDHGECRDCIHKDGEWCNLMQLPVTINPYLTMKHGMIGFACQGAGYESPEKKEDDQDSSDGQKIEKGDIVRTPCGNDSQVLLVTGKYALIQMIVLRKKEQHKLEDLTLITKKEYL